MAQAFPKSKKELEARLIEDMKEITLEEVREILESTIKHDVENKLICFLGMILNYTSEDQINIGFNSESSTGKSYIPLELSYYFPERDVRIQGYTSPTAFFHEYGEWDDEKKVKTIDLKQKILIFVDQPHDMLLQRLRPLLSHDKRIISHRITDRSQKHGLSTKHIQIRGYPTVIFCTTKFSLDEQERTRLLLLSPEIGPEKIMASIQLLTNRLSNRQLFAESLERDEGRRFLKARILAIRNVSISEIIISQEDREVILERFLRDHPFLIPRHQRDYPRLISMIKAHALLNFEQRECIEVNGERMIVVTQTDIDAGYSLYKGISRSNELGVAPEVLTFFERVVVPELDEPRLVDRSTREGNDEVGLTGLVSKKDLSRRYFEVFHKPIGKKRLKRLLEMLLETGLLVEGKNPVDRRETIYSHPTGYISSRLNRVQKQPRIDDAIYTPEGVGTTRRKE